MCRTVLTVVIVATGAGEVSAERERPTLDRCAQLVRDRPEDLDSYLCYWLVARSGQWEPAARALEALLAIDPSDHRARLYLAAIENDRGLPRAQALYREAAEGFRALGDPKGEVYARLSLCASLNRSGRTAEALVEVGRAAVVAEQATEQPELRARVWSVQSAMAMKEQRYALALTLVRRAEAVAFPDGPSDLQSSILSRLGYAYWAQGLHARALQVYAREAELMRELEAGYLECGARFNIALLSAELLDTERLGIDEHLENVRAALDLSVRVGNRRVEARTRMLLARALGGEEGIEEIRRALAISREIGERSLSREAQRQLALALGSETPPREQEALRILRDSIEEARSDGNLEDQAMGLSDLARISRGISPRKVWFEAYEETFEIVERIRDIQPDGTVGARLFSRWAPPYYRFADGLLEGLPASPDPEGDLDLAFRTVERMRSRVLLDELDTAGAPTQYDSGHPVAVRRAEVLREIAAIQKRLANPDHPAGERDDDLRALEGLELEEEALRQQLAREAPAYAALRAPNFPTLAEVRGRLAPDQAILAYQVSDVTDPAGGEARSGSWVILISKDEVAAFPLPERRTLQDRVAVFLGLTRRRDGSDAAAAELLYTDLLCEPLRRVDPEVRRLVIVPDGCLHRLPFAALRPYADGAPLGASHQISRVPSVRLWMRWNQLDASTPAPGGAASVLALADPEHGHGTALDQRLRTADPWAEGVQLGPLPSARSEAARLLRAAGGSGRVVTGGEASERLLKETDLGGYRLLHLAVHALVDDDHPERSAIVLAPGGEGEDGFLQTREILDLDLADTIVILSACRSATGTVLHGEGTLGLTRAFFQAGARAVVGNLWPMRDDEAEALMRELARGLGEGRSLSGALNEARAVRIEAGDPVAAWAGLVVLGDGDVVPIPSSRPGTENLLFWGALALGVALLSGTAVVTYRRLRA